jgi:DNA-binding transcriptional LysR family regulator
LDQEGYFLVINLNQLRAFYQAARCQNFSLAAKTLFVTQPAVTAQVKLLEENCGFNLFIKRGGKLYLTEEGKDIYEYACKIFNYEEKIEQVIERTREYRHGALRLGTVRTYARYFLPFLISLFRQSHPKIIIHMDEGNSLEMMNSLYELKNHVVILARLEDNPEVCFKPLSLDELVLILPPDHDLARNKVVSMEELKDERIIMKEEGSGTRKLVDALFERSGVTPNVLMETTDAEIIKMLVQHGEGISFLAKETVAAELRDHKLATVHLKGKRTFWDVGIAYLETIPISPPTRAFLNTLDTLMTDGKPVHGLADLAPRMLNLHA